MAEYRWNKHELAAGYDASAEYVHPHYLELQDFLVRAIATLQPDASTAAPYVVDLGGGTGRLAEKILKALPAARVLVIDQAEPALEIARKRLAPFADRAATAVSQLQGEWEQHLAEPPTAIVSMSAIHHLDPGEKEQLYRRCHAALASGGYFANGDEVRDPQPEIYLAQVATWGKHMDRVMAAGLIAESFHDALHQ